MKKLLWLLWLIPGFVSAQQVYWVSFTHKRSSFNLSEPKQFLSERALQRRKAMGISLSETDLPVSPELISTLQSGGYTIVSSSKWLNGVAVLAQTKMEAEALKLFPFVGSVTPLGTYKKPKNYKLNEDGPVLHPKQERKDSSVYGVSFTQLQTMNLPALHQQKYTGNGVWVAVLDAGFYKAQSHPGFKTLFQSGRILAQRDFVVGDTNVFNDDNHGLAVLSCLAANQPGIYKGAAPDAYYVLLRCEDALSEMPIEEVYWAAAAEFADSMGVDVINSSLGYNEFDEAAQNHKVKQLNGKTTLISKAASMAVATGMVVVNSAGNEGNDAWHYVAVPADVATVLTVGGVNAKGDYVAFSSMGPTADKRIKPDVAAMAENVWVASPSGSYYQGDGTSYASPLMAGAVACLLQRYPYTTPEKVMKVLQQSSSQYYKADKYLGYGVPDLKLAFDMLGAERSGQPAFIDARRLNDHKLHVVIAAAEDQQMVFTCSKPDGSVVWTETLTIKKGVKRYVLNRSKKMGSGTYRLNCKSALTLDQLIEIHLP